MRILDAVMIVTTPKLSYTNSTDHISNISNFLPIYILIFH